jgi:hypothetical protein
MQTFVETVGPRRGLKASVMNVGNHYTLDVASRAGVIVVPAAEGHATAPVAAGDLAEALGAVAYDLATVAPSATADFAAGDVAEVCDQGDMWLVAEAGLTVGAQPFCRFAASVNGTILGAVRVDADGATAGLLPNCRVLAVVAGLAKVRINLPHGAAA